VLQIGKNLTREVQWTVKPILLNVAQFIQLDKVEREICICQDGGQVEIFKNIDHLNGKHYPLLATFPNSLDSGPYL